MLLLCCCYVADVVHVDVRSVVNRVVVGVVLVMSLLFWLLIFSMILWLLVCVCLR